MEKSTRLEDMLLGPRKANKFMREIGMGTSYNVDPPHIADLKRSIARIKRDIEDLRTNGASLRGKPDLQAMMQDLLGYLEDAERGLQLATEEWERYGPEDRERFIRWYNMFWDAYEDAERGFTWWGENEVEDAGESGIPSDIRRRWHYMDSLARRFGRCVLPPPMPEDWNGEPVFDKNHLGF